MHDEFIKCKMRLKPKKKKNYKILDSRRRLISPHPKKNRDDLRNKFRREYLGQLRPRLFKKGNLKKPQISHTVLLEDANKRRIY